MTREVRRHEGERAVSEMGGKAVDAMRAAITHTHPLVCVMMLKLAENVAPARLIIVLPHLKA